LARKFPSPDPYPQPDSPWSSEVDLDDEDSYAPSLPIILLSAACGLAGGIIGLYVTVRVLQWNIQVSMALATLIVLFGLGTVSWILSALTGSRAFWTNIGFSCGLILISLLFFGLCLVSGALVATLMLFSSL